MSSPAADPTCLGNNRRHRHRIYYPVKHRDRTIYALALALAFALACLQQSIAQVAINEIVAANQSIINNDGIFSDYVELINLTTQPVELAGMSLTDDPSNPRAFVFPTGAILDANARILLWCDELHAHPGFHTGFALNAGSEQVTLFAADGVSTIDQVRFGPQIADLAIARIPDGTGAWTLAQPTPLQSNVTVIAGPPSALRINEWMARPATGEDWLELHNASDWPVVLDALVFTDRPAIPPTNRPIPPLSFIGPRGFVQFFASDLARNDANHLDFRLSSDAETIRLFDTNRLTVLESVTYGPQTANVSQGRIPDGGTTIVSFPAGTSTPGAPNRSIISDVVISEVLTHSDPPFEDAIELHNLGSTLADLSHWWLSDSLNQPQKYRFPHGTSIAPGDFLVIYQYQFGAGPSGFALDSAEGDRVVLSAGNSNGELTGAQTSVEFGALRRGISAGRHPTSLGVDFVPLSQRTFGQDNPTSVSHFRQGQGASNAPPAVGPVVLSEFHPRPSVAGQFMEHELEFIELHNPTAATVGLFDPAYPTNTWRIRSSVSLNLPFQLSIGPGAYALLVGFDPHLEPARAAAFRLHYDVPETVPLWGPYSGTLPNLTGLISLLRPDAPEGPDDPNAGFVPYEQVEAFNYSLQSPWPDVPAGHSLHRIVPDTYANEPLHWLAAIPTPGRPVPMDQDNDGMPDSWEITHHLNPLSAADAVQDPDLDGASNFAEFHAGTDPRNAHSVLKIEITALSPDQIQVQFNSVAGRRYELQFSSLQASDIWQPIMQLGPFPNDGLRQLALEVFTNDSAHYRLSLPDAP